MLEPINIQFKKRPIIILAGFVFAWVGLGLVYSCLDVRLGSAHFGAYEAGTFDTFHGRYGRYMNNRTTRFIIGIGGIIVGLGYAWGRIKLWIRRVPQFYADENGVTIVGVGATTSSTKYQFNLQWNQIDRICFGSPEPGDSSYVIKKPSKHRYLKLYLTENFYDENPHVKLRPFLLALETISHNNKRKAFMEDLRKFSDKVELIKN